MEWSFDSLWISMEKQVSCPPKRLLSLRMFCNPVMPTSIKLEHTHEGHEGVGGGAIYIQCHPEAEQEHCRDTFILLPSTFSWLRTKDSTECTCSRKDGHFHLLLQFYSWTCSSNFSLLYDNYVRCNTCHSTTGLVQMIVDCRTQMILSFASRLRMYHMARKPFLLFHRHIPDYLDNEMTFRHMTKVQKVRWLSLAMYLTLIPG